MSIETLMQSDKSQLAVPKLGTNQLLFKFDACGVNRMKLIGQSGIKGLASQLQEFSGSRSLQTWTFAMVFG